MSGILWAIIILLIILPAWYYFCIPSFESSLDETLGNSNSSFSETPAPAQPAQAQAQAQVVSTEADVSNNGKNHKSNSGIIEC